MVVKTKNDPANTDYKAGDYFNYEVWEANTELTLCNVPWDAMYRDVWEAESTEEINQYIEERGDTTTIDKSIYARVDEPVRISMPFERASRYNYIRVFNPAQPVNGGDIPRYYYYFIRGVRHVAPNTTEILVQLDIWTTYRRRVQFGRAYVDRGHVGIANEKAFDSFGREYLSIPDGLDIGAEYVNVNSRRIRIMYPSEASGDTSQNFNIMAVSTVNLVGDHGTEKNPKNPSAVPSYIVRGIPSGAGVYFWDSASEFMAFLKDYSSKSWVTQGIVSITLIPPGQRYLAFGQKWLGNKDPKTRARTTYIKETQIRRNLFPNWRRDKQIMEYIPPRYRHLKKFLTSPYCMIQLGFSAASNVILRPEAWNSDHATVMDMISVIPGSQRLAIVPLNYNGRNKTPEGNDGILPMESGNRWWVDGDYLDMAVYLTSFPTIPIVNNGQIMALASQARSIAAQYGSLDWAQTRSLQGNQVAYDQASAGINAGVDLANNSLSADAQQTAIAQNLASQQALLGLVGGTASGAGMGAFAGPAGAIAGGVGGLASGAMGMIGGALQADAANQSLAVRLSSGGAARDINSGLGTYMRDTNRGLADWAAKGDYANARAQMDARIQDIQMTPHGVSGQFGGEAFNLSTGNADLIMRIKMIDQASIATIGEYWLRYGYPVHRTMRLPNDLRVMDKFSYWKATEVYILTAGMPEVHKQAFRGIIEKGVTVWGNPEDIGRIDFADNRPLKGVFIDGYEPPAWEPEPDPEPPVTKKRKKRNMYVLTTIDSGVQKWALAGSSAGNIANFLETDNTTLGLQWLAACDQTEPVTVEPAYYYELKAAYLAPISNVPTTEP